MLDEPRGPEALPPAAAVSLTPVRRSWSYLRLPRFKSLYTAIPSFGLPNWLQLVERLGGGIVYDDVLESSQNKILPLGSGLKFDLAGQIFCM